MHKGKWVWVDGKFELQEKSSISIFSHSLHYGFAAFEGIRAYQQPDGKGAIFRLNEHIDRLFETLHILGLPIAYTAADLALACKELCKENEFTECYLRPLVFIGDSGLGIYPGLEPKIHTAILCWKWGSYLGDRALGVGVKLKISSFIRSHVNCLMTKGKITGQYVNSVLAKMEAKKLGFDEALLLDEYGFLTEGTGENLFIVKNREIKTTPLNSILNGVTRQTVMHLLEQKGFQIKEQQFTRDELWCAHEAFLTGTAAEITAIDEVDFRKIGAQKNTPKSITADLQKTFFELVRGQTRVKGTEDWLSLI